MTKEYSDYAEYWSIRCPKLIVIEDYRTSNFRQDNKTCKGCELKFEDCTLGKPYFFERNSYNGDPKNLKILLLLNET